MVKEDIKDQKKLMDFFIDKAKKAKVEGVGFPFPSINKTNLTKEEAVLMVERLKCVNKELGKRLEVELSANILVEKISHQLLFLNKVLQKMIKELQKERDEARQERDQGKQEEKGSKGRGWYAKEDNKWLFSLLRICRTCQLVNLKSMPSMKHRAKIILSNFSLSLK